MSNELENNKKSSINWGGFLLCRLFSTEDVKEQDALDVIGINEKMNGGMVMKEDKVTAFIN
ncbi:hypothetical protein [Paenibacillus endoradicis]|uniref:hypothetical protein n=1 Tax=Paenibacillus endoradicis TaxID=2972487 RepID=UPI0021591820|nr:hypothetical protein [Paenibacillus endoradicis]MCR8658955.1 hypothetical protein [Paenibacillus endoradicis]